MPKEFQIALALLGPCLDVIGAFLLSVYVVAGSEKMESALQSLRTFSFGLAIRASQLVYRDPNGFKDFLEAPISKTPGAAATHWLLFPFVFSALIVPPFFFPLFGAITYSCILVLLAGTFSIRFLTTGLRLAIYALLTTLIITLLFTFIPLNTIVLVLFVPVVFLLAYVYLMSIPLGFVFLVSWAVEKEQEKRVSLLGLLLLLSGFVVQGVYNVTTLY